MDEVCRYIDNDFGYLTLEIKINTEAAIYNMIKDDINII